MNSQKPPLFDFFDVVQVVNMDGNVAEIDRMFGIILGKSHHDNGEWGYSVQVCSDEACECVVDGWAIHEKNLVATGRSVSEDHVYGGETIKVSQSGEPSD